MHPTRVYGIRSEASRIPDRTPGSGSPCAKQVRNKYGHASVTRVHLLLGPRARPTALRGGRCGGPPFALASTRGGARRRRNARGGPKHRFGDARRQLGGLHSWRVRRPARGRTVGRARRGRAARRARHAGRAAWKIGPARGRRAGRARPRELAASQQWRGSARALTASSRSRVLRDRAGSSALAVAAVRGDSADSLRLAACAEPPRP